MMPDVIPESALYAAENARQAALASAPDATDRSAVPPAGAALPLSAPASPTSTVIDASSAPVTGPAGPPPLKPPVGASAPPPAEDPNNPVQDVVVQGTKPPPPPTAPAPVTPPLASDLKPAPDATLNPPPSVYGLSSTPDETHSIPVHDPNGNVKYAHPSEVKALEGSDLVAATANAMIHYGDAAVGTTMLKNAQELRSAELGAAAEQYGNALMPLIAKAENGDLSVIGKIDALAERNPGTILTPKSTLNKDGSVTVQRFIKTDHGTMEAGPPITYDSVAAYGRHALSLASPAAMVANATEESNLASKAAETMHTIHTMHNEDTSAPIKDALTRAQTTAELAQAGASNRANKDSKDNPTEGVLKVPDGQGGSVEVPTQKFHGQTMVSDPVFGTFVDYAKSSYANPDAAKHMVETAKANGLQLVVSPTGMPMYSNGKDPPNRNPDAITPKHVTPGAPSRDASADKRVGGVFNTPPTKRKPGLENSKVVQGLGAIGSAAASAASRAGEGLSGLAGS